MRQDNEVLTVHYLYIAMLYEHKMFKIEPGFREMEFKKECYVLCNCIHYFKIYQQEQLLYLFINSSVLGKVLTFL